LKLVFLVQDIIGNIFFLESGPLKVDIKVTLLYEVLDLLLGSCRDITAGPTVERLQIWRNFQKV